MSQRQKAPGSWLPWLTLPDSLCTSCCFLIALMVLLSQTRSFGISSPINHGGLQIFTIIFLCLPNFAEATAQSWLAFQFQLAHSQLEGKDWTLQLGTALYRSLPAIKTQREKPHFRHDASQRVPVIQVGPSERSGTYEPVQMGETLVVHETKCPFLRWRKTQSTKVHVRLVIYRPYTGLKRSALQWCIIIYRDPSALNFPISWSSPM